MGNFNINAFIRGAQLTLVGCHRALQNPNLFTSDHYKQAILAVFAGVLIRLILVVPNFIVRVILTTLSFVIDLDHVTWDDHIVNWLHFFEHSVLQIPFFLMTLMRYITPSLDQMFMNSLAWVDYTYIQKHRRDNPQNLRGAYYDNLDRLPKHTHLESSHSRLPIQSFLSRYTRRTTISLIVYCASCLPWIGRFVIPAASFYTFRKSVGVKPAIIIFTSASFLPKRYLINFLQSYFSCRSLMRELLEPYFSRVPFTKQQKANWFSDRTGVLFGFSLTFYFLIRIPLLGVLIYGIAEASTAYLITKISDPPPAVKWAQSPDIFNVSNASSDSLANLTLESQENLDKYVQSQVKWSQKHKFLSLPLARADELNFNYYKRRFQASGEPLSSSGTQSERSPSALFPPSTKLAKDMPSKRYA